jgi:glycosyltransferase involved in cell wall biosynthesis
MKLAQINTYTYGGAAVVARRLHLALLDLHVDSVLVTKSGIPNQIPRHVFLKNGKFRELLRKKASSPALFPLIKRMQRYITHPNLKGRQMGLEIFSPLYHGAENATNFADAEQANIIHLHWVNDFLDYEPFFKKFADRKFVWTLHDMNPITGGCHHSDGCMKFQSVCVQCPQLANTIDQNYSAVVQEFKIKGLQYLNDDQMIVVSPSVWLAEHSKKSSIMGRFKHVVIPNPAFKLRRYFNDKAISRTQLHLPLDKKIIIFASENLNNPRKGTTLLFEAVQHLPEKDAIVLVGIGQKGISPAGLNVLYPGRISNVDLFASYLQAADIFVTPTIAENSPLVVIESLCCGTPVVASDVGGIPDLVNDSNGILFPVGNIQALADAIAQALFEKKFDPQKISESAVAIHNPMKIATEYSKVYQSFF